MQTKALLLSHNPRMRLALSALALVVVAFIAFAALNVGVADAARHEGYYPCWVEDYGWMWCKDIP